MFPKKTLDLVLLSILDENPEGMTGYALVREIKQRFNPKIKNYPKENEEVIVVSLSPGTLYPRSRKMIDSGDITLEKESKLFQITDQGKRRLTEKIPNLMKYNLNFIPKLFKVLTRPLSNQHSHYIPDFKDYIDNSIFSHPVPDEDITRNIKELESLKKEMDETKNRTNDIIKKIEGRIAELIDQKNSRVKIEILDGDNK
jgi:DNA-binding PadR family transcriptional regulator